MVQIQMRRILLFHQHHHYQMKDPLPLALVFRPTLGHPQTLSNRTQALPFGLELSL
jgi:hypothetical protein